MHRRLAGPCLLVPVLCALLAPLEPARADSHDRAFVPEINAFANLSDRTRLYLLGALSRNLTQNATDGDVGIHLDLSLLPVLRPRLYEANWARNRYLWMRAGYVYSSDADGRADGFTEHRVILELTQRLELPNDIWLVNRGRIDFRDVDGAFSKRFRLRMGIEREFSAADTVLVPYAQAETFYDSRYGNWNRQLYQAGVEVELTKRWRVETYLSRQNDNRSASGNVDALGLVLKYYR